MAVSVMSFWAKITRPQDLLEITLEFRDVEVTTPQGNQPARLKGLAASRLVVYFQSQHVAEEAVFQTAAKTPPPPFHTRGIMKALFSGPSRLVFSIPAGKEIDYTLEGILGALQEMPLLVSPIMSYEPPGCSMVFPFSLFAPPAPAVGKPGADITAIEAPYRLILSPDDKARWSHASAPVEHMGRTELWHTRLGSGDSRHALLLRAIWSPDFDPKKHVPAVDKPFLMSLKAYYRNQLVHLTSNWNLTVGPGGGKGRYQPEPVEADQLMLSTLGAWLKVHGNWPVVRGINLPENNETLTVEEWRHEASMGRDQYVRVVEAGFLYPFGHRAVKVVITERKFFYEPEQQGYTAYLFQRMFIVVRQPTREYAYREMPLKSVTIRTRVTPDLNPAKESEVLTGSGEGAFWPMIELPGGQKVDFQFQLAAEDWEGNSVEFTCPLIFVDINFDGKANPSGQQSDMEKVTKVYDALAMEKDPRRYRPFSGQPVAFAPTTTGKQGTTTMTTKYLSFSGPYLSGGAPHFRPEMSLATVDIPAVARMMGTTKAYDIRLDEAFTSKKQGNPSSAVIGNQGEVFAKVTPAEALAFQVDKGGGLVAPDIKITALSRAFGPVDNSDYGQALNIANGHFSAPDIFGSKVQLLGGIELGKILRVDEDFGDPAKAADFGRIPGLTSEIVDDGGVQTAVTRYKYHVDPPGFAVGGHDIFEPNDATDLVIESEVRTPLNGDPGAYRLSGKLSKFAVVLGVKTPPAGVTIHFQKLSFLAETNKKPDVSVDLKSVEFTGILAFINALSEVVPLDGFSDPPHLDITTEGIELGYSLGLPMTAVGMFSLQNISLSAGVFLPLLSDKPLNFRFAFCERHQPFLMTVTLFGGGGFVGLDIGLHGLVMVEAALEFGAAAAINLGVASGALSFMGGVYYQKAGTNFELTGYFRANGALSVLGLITVSVEFYLGLTYTSKGSGADHAGAMWGQAKLTVKIKIAFFSKSVSISMEREFAGSDPYFAQLMEPTDWTLYCAAFANY